MLPYPEFDPVAIQLGPFAVRWYAISYIAGLLAGWWLLTKMLAQKPLWSRVPFSGKPPATADDIGDLFVWATLGVVIGGRLGYDLFYGIFYCGLWPEGRDCVGLPMAFWHNPFNLLAYWDPAPLHLFGRTFHLWMPRLLGMSFHGGLIGVVVAVILFCRSRKLAMFQVGDLIASVAPIGLFFGRLANFINGELWGKLTDSPIGMVFCSRHLYTLYRGCPAGLSPRYPSQLIEALSSFISWHFSNLAMKRLLFANFSGVTYSSRNVDFGSVNAFWIRAV